MTVRVPRTSAEWASVLLAVSLLTHAGYSWLAGDMTQAFVDLSAAFGTIGLPSLVGSGYHIEVHRDAE